MGKSDISTNSILCTVADKLSIVPSIYLSTACTVLDNVSRAGDIAVNKNRPKEFNPQRARSLMGKQRINEISE